ncbi:MAG: F0F1 ATP synthase subunit epsilon [Ignavibacteria bacterium]|nr:F0F1 ATP synthase subunit epsilon [Ignavibacteria bacterium]MBT8383633.1 F0F1 ATP synthase subunit epsilon [Ignavibacteria bacterium]MBT8393161.1 F0F1 ATP synthase subunit epsilon [Ignavibacteria bacterium]NNJ53770.1 F0F1 ATP synthase subunit epsilon [Ignavibacteriaceae bacterium]NNL21283.1 F0F1 ATP synthase subunit epsilon [Ignavibacteriaceae bacterium]
MAEEINLEIITPEKAVLKDQVDAITIPGSLGSFQVLKNHAPLISNFEVGVIKVKKNSDVIHLTTSGGTVEVKDNVVLILANSAENVNKIDSERAEHAQKRAEERLAQKQKEEIDEARAEAALKRALNRLNAKQKYL